MKNAQFPVARKNGLVVQEIPGEVLIYDLDKNEAHCLNSTAAAVWKTCDGSNSISDIARSVGNELNNIVSDDLVWLAIDQLGENDLLERQLETKFVGHTRRDVLKKIGFASIVAIPVIASLVAPKDALASGSCGCMTNGQCAAAQRPAGCTAGNTCTNDSVCVTVLGPGKKVTGIS